ncbi:MAG: hypothetical protein ACRDR6_10490 [Pseudonocardiaceae bacterium]
MILRISEVGVGTALRPSAKVVTLGDIPVESTRLLRRRSAANHLDIRYQHEVLDLIRRIRVTTIAVLHNLILAARYCDRLVLLDRSEVAAAGYPHDALPPACRNRSAAQLYPLS